MFWCANPGSLIARIYWPLVAYAGDSLIFTKRNFTSAQYVTLQIKIG
jgi:hypothetical protein